MQGSEVYDVLKQIGATHLHHANSVITSCTFLEQGGLLSRGLVDDHGLKQTPQPSSDEIDKKFGIWHSIFVDHVDIHDRAGRKKGPNYYGPVLFVFGLDILAGLPAGTDIQVTKRNPVHWLDGEPVSDRYFQSVDELAKSIRFGNFDKMLVIQTPSEKLDFTNRRAHISLDNPVRQLSSGENAYAHAQSRLNAAAAVGGIAVSIQQRACPNGCVCVKKYAADSTEKFESCFA
jgi:hypothetical protein